MANVTGRERGRMSLVASLIVAASFVGPALVVDDAVYTENLSTRETSGDDPSARAVVYEASVDAGFRSGSVVRRDENLRARWSEVA